MKVLSLFDGMACGYIAIQELGIPIECYDAYEIDKYAIQAATHNFPDIVEKGDVFTEDFSKHKGQYDILIGGSPCTYWSIAKKENRETEASGMGWDLFCQFVKALNETKPKYFLYENNKSMSKAIKESISQTFGFEPTLINSALVSAQNRQRFYWCGIRQNDGAYIKANIPQPEDRQIILKDVLESGTDLTCNNKAYCLTHSYGGACAWNTIERKQRSMVAESVQVGKATPTSFDSQGIPLKAKSEIDGKEYEVYCVKNGNITIKNKEYSTELLDGYYIARKLTIIECKRLQTVPEWYEFPTSNTQSYKMLGNGWTVEVIKHLISNMIKLS